MLLQTETSWTRKMGKKRWTQTAVRDQTFFHAPAVDRLWIDSHGSCFHQGLCKAQETSEAIFVLCVSSFCWGYTYLGDLSCNLYVLELNWIQEQCLSSWPYCTWVCVFVHGFGYQWSLSQCPVSGCHLGTCWCFRAMMPLGLWQWGYCHLQCQQEPWWDVGQASINDHVLVHCSAAAWVSVNVHDLCCHRRPHGCPATGLPVVAR